MDLINERTSEPKAEMKSCYGAFHVYPNGKKGCYYIEGILFTFTLCVFPIFWIWGRTLKFRRAVVSESAHIYIYIYKYLVRPKNCLAAFFQLFTLTFWVKTDPIVFSVLPAFQRYRTSETSINKLSVWYQFSQNISRSPKERIRIAS